MIEKWDNPLTDEYKALKNFDLNTDEMSWYYNSETLPLDSDYRISNDLAFYGHKVLGRPDINAGHPFSAITSQLFEKTYQVMQQIFDYNNTPLKVIYRINFNCVHAQRGKQSTWHRDIEIPHKNLIIYLSKFTDGWTYLKNSDKIEKSEPIEDGIIVFDDELHCHAPPKELEERRIVLVACWL